MDAPNTETLVFWPWISDDVETSAVRVDSRYSRDAWLPVLGPTAWLLWGTVADEFTRTPECVWSVAELARRHGIGYRSKVLATLDRLVMFRLATVDRDGRWLVRPTCPPLWPRQLAQQPAWVMVLHAETWGIDLRDRPTA